MVGVPTEHGWLIYHANTPLSKRVREEVERGASLMAEYKLANGYVLSDDEIERSAREWGDGTWEGPLIELRVGRPQLADEPNANLSFKCPVSGAAMIERAASLLGVKKSAFMRDAALEKAVHVLAASS